MVLTGKLRTQLARCLGPLESKISALACNFSFSGMNVYDISILT
jgi:hypothetical protein